MLSKEEIEKIKEQIEQLEKDKIGYLEIDDKAGARRKAKRIEELEMQLELDELDKIKQELQIHKEVIRNYPSVQNEIKRRLLECQIKKK